MENTNILITVIPNGAAVLLILGVLLRSRGYYGKEDPEGGCFRSLVRSVIWMAAIDLVRDLVQRRGFMIDAGELLSLEPEEMAEALFATGVYVLNLFLTTLFFFSWLRYVSWKLYPGRDYARRRFRITVSPLLISGVAAMLGMVLALFIPYSGPVQLVLLLVFLLIRMGYFLMSLILIRRYRKQNGALKFFNIPSFCIPVLLGALIQDYSVLPLRALGAAIGVLFLYASMEMEQRYLDRETGLYHPGYRQYLKKRIRKGRFDPHSALSFEISDAGGMKELAETLKEELPEDCECIRVSEKKALALTPVREKAPLLMAMEDVQAETEAEVSCVLREKTEAAEAFLERVL